MAQKLQIEYVEGARISTIGIGFDVDQGLLRNIAKQGNGHFYFLDSSDRLADIMREDLTSLVVPALKDINLDITTYTDFDILNAYGVESDASITSN